MMNLDSAIQHCKEQVQEQAKGGCYSCAEEHQQLAEWLKELKAYKEQSGDAISRQAVMEHYSTGEIAHCNHVSRNNLLDFIEQLPSVTPQQRTGRWIQKEEEGDAEPFIIWECSECHCVDEDGKPSYKYCPQCGAKMEVEE